MKLFGLNIDFSKLKHFRKREVKKKDGNLKPHRDWVVVVVTSLSILIIAGVFNYLYFVGVENEIEESRVELREQSIDRSKLKSIIEHFDKRSEKFSDIQTRGTFVRDPSI